MIKTKVKTKTMLEGYREFYSLLIDYEKKGLITANEFRKFDLKFLMQKDYRKQVVDVLIYGKPVCLKCGEVKQPEYMLDDDEPELSHWECKCGSQIVN